MKLYICQLVVVFITLPFSFFNVAAEKNSFSPYVFVSVSYDDNFYKVSPEYISENLLLDGNKLDDTIKSSGAGIDVDWNVSKQKISLNALITDNAFANNVQFDNKSKQYQAKWNWHFGKALSGAVSSSYDKSLASFIDNQFLALAGANKIRRTNSFDVKWRIHPEWQIGSEVAKKSIGYSGTDSNDNDFNTEVIGLNFAYLTETENNIGIRLTRQDTDYPNRVFTDGGLDNYYKTNSLGMTFDWHVTEKSNFSGFMGYESLSYSNTTERDYKDWSANISYALFVSNKFKIQSKIWNEVKPSQSVIANFQRSRGGEVSSTWLIGAKSLLSLSLERENRLLDGIFTDGSSQLFIEEDYHNFESSFSYELAEYVNIQLGAAISKRKSNSISRSFNSKMVFSSIRIIW